jgi:hypothetical protein
MCWYVLIVYRIVSYHYPHTPRTEHRARYSSHTCGHVSCVSMCRITAQKREIGAHKSVQASARAVSLSAGPVSGCLLAS